jgi:hypothetical protein
MERGRYDQDRVASIAIFALTESVEAARMRRGSSWEFVLNAGKVQALLKASSSPAASRLSSSNVKIRFSEKRDWTLPAWQKT